jgi:hypothetical protein
MEAARLLRAARPDKGRGGPERPSSTLTERRSAPEFFMKNLLARLFPSRTKTLRKPSGPAPRRPRLGVEGLETRCVMSTLPSALSVGALSNMTIPLGSNAQVTFDSSGSLASVDAHVNSASFTRGGVTFNANDLHVTYTAADSEFDISGTASATLAGKTVSVTFGSDSQPGIVVQGNALQSFTGTLTLPALSLGGATLSSSGVTVGYNAANDEIDLGGSATLDLTSGQEFGLQLGDPTTGAAGVAIQGGQFTSLNAAVSGNFTVGGLSVHSDGLRVVYAAPSAGSPQLISISGGADFALKGNTVSVALGDGTSPGLVIQDGQLSSLTASVTADIHLFGMTLHSKDLTVGYVKALDQVTVYGDLSFSAGDGRMFKGIAASLGTASSPGLVIQNGDLTSLDVTLNGGFQLAGFALTANNLEVRYDAPSHQMQIRGGVDVQLTPRIHGSANLTDGGITIDTRTGAVQVNGVEFMLDAQMGAFAVHDLDIKYTNTGGVIGVAASGDVTFPVGFSVGGSFSFQGGRLQEIGLRYDAGNTTGIAVGDTGMFVTHIEGRIDHLDDPTNLNVDATLGVTYGKSVTVLGKTYALFAATGHVHVNRNELDIDADVQLEGGFMGTGHAAVQLNWAQGVYSAKVNVGIYGGIFQVGGTITFRSDDSLTLDVTGGLDLPDALPVVGGMQLAGAKLHLQYSPLQGAQNYISGTASVVGVGDVTFSEDFNGNSSLNLVKNGLVDAYKYLQNGFETLHTQFNNGVALLKESWAVTGSHIKDTWNGTGRYVHEAWVNGVQTLRQVFVGALMATQDIWDSMGDHVQDEWDDLGNHVKDTWFNGAQTLHQEWQGALLTMRTTWDGVGDMFRQTWDATGKHIEAYFHNGVETAEKTFQNGVIALEKDWDAAGGMVEKLFSNGVETAEKDFSNGVQTLEKDWDSAGNYVQTTFSNGVAQATQKFDAAGHAIASTATGVANDVGNAIVNTGTSVLNKLGIKI